MINYGIWLCVVTLVQLSLICLWFDSQIFSPLFQWCLRQKKDKWYTWFIFTLLTCPQCLGYWLAWFCAAAGYFLPGSPLQGHALGYNAWVVFYTGLAAAVLSRFVDGFIPEPVNQKLFVVEVTKPEETKEEEETNGD